eukprot:CAMPEP_0196580232 /NCGR_PEP_ID=MMETSP1081-20130531/27978_1 /TAXON_ID=36882 /ORGANISM="Pyramimonas amylifera, Strain CCMP720" /LENGTH=210 /DNA_ID=CAMNT_0041900059 /DNA_START=203 /DNA_END=835 /DNA_ORIENTATION=+
MRHHFTRLLNARNNEDPHLVYIPDAAIAEGGTFRDLCSRRTRELRFAATIECIELKRIQRHQLALKLAKCDGVYVDYGNTFYLMHYIRASGFEDLITPLVLDGLLFVGSSASTICAGETVSIAFWKGWDNPGFGEEWDLKESALGYQGLRLVPGVSFFPHFSERWDNLVKEKQSTLGHVLITLSDTQAFLDEGFDHRRVLETKEKDFNDL